MRISIPAIITVLVLAVPVTRAQVDEAARLFDAGNLHYRGGEFEDARIAYEQALELGYESGALYYNLGNAYFRLDRLGLAMLYYQRASRSLPGDDEIEHNVRQVKSRSRDRFSQVPEPVFSKWWNTSIDRIGIRTLFWFGAFFWIAGIALVGHGLWMGAFGAWHKRAATLLAAAGFVLIAGILATSAARSTNARGVVISDRAELREEPSNGSRSDVAVHEALVVDVLGRSGGWTRIRLPNGVTGFVRSESVQIV